MNKLYLITAITLFFSQWSYGQIKLEESQLSNFNFRAVGPALTSGRIIDIAVNENNPDEFYVAAASGGVWKTLNHGVTFTPVFDTVSSYSIGCISMDPNNPNVVWVGTGENNNQRSVGYGSGLYRSRDGGKSWDLMGLQNSEHIGMITINPQNSNEIYVAAYGPLWSSGGDRGLYKTTDGGYTWVKILEIDEYTGVNEVHLDPEDEKTIYATAHQRMRHVWTYVGGGPGSGIYKSSDGGKSFRELKSGLPSANMGRIGMAIAPSDPSILYAIIEAEQNHSGVYVSKDKGESWMKVNDYVTSGNYYQEVFVDPHNPNKVFFMDTYAHFTVNGGKDIQKLPEGEKHVDNHALWIDKKNTNHYLMGCDGGLYETFDDAKNWKYYPNIPITQFYRVTVDNRKPFYYIYGGTQDNFSIGGPSRTRKLSGIDNYDWFVTNEGDGFESQIDPLEPDIVYAQAQYGWLVRYDKKSGESTPIKPIPRLGEEPYRWNWDAPLLISPHNNKRLYFAANKVFRSDDQGNSWTVISDDLSRQTDRHTLPVMGKVQSIDAVMYDQSTSIYGNIVSLSESPVKEGLLFAGTDDGLIHISEDGGDSWRKVSLPKAVPERTYVNDIKTSLHNENVLYAAFNNHKNGDFKPYLYKSENKGFSWTFIGGDLPQRGSVYAIAEDHKNPDLLFVGTEFGVFVTVDGGKNWTQLKNGVPTIAVRDIDIQRDVDDVILGTFGRGFYVLDDYSALRQIDKETLNDDFKIFTSRPGLAYIPDSKYGYSGSGFQGANFFKTPNPDMGVTLFYYLKESPQMKSTARRKAEKEALKEGKDLQYPTREDIYTERLEEKPYLLFVISNENGNEVHRGTSKVSEGIGKYNWSGKVSGPKDLDLKEAPFTVPEEAQLALPGKYYVAIYLSEDGILRILEENHEIELKRLNMNTIVEDPGEAYAFQNSLNSMRREAYGVDQFFRDMQTRVQRAKANARSITNTNTGLLTHLRAIEKSLTRIEMDLYGDRIMEDLQFEVAPGIMSRLGTAAWSSWSNQSKPTQIQRDQLEDAEKGLEKAKSELKSLDAQLLSIEMELNDQGAPYLPGALPKYR